MKVSDILNEDREECVSTTVKEIFHENYEDISGVSNIDPEDLLDIMRDITAKQRDVNFQKEEQILTNIVEMSNEETVYIVKSENLHAQLDELSTAITGGGSLMQTITAIQKFVRILGKYTTTESAWEESDEGAKAHQEAAETCSEPSDEYARVGMKPSDFY